MEHKIRDKVYFDTPFRTNASGYIVKIEHNRAYIKALTQALKSVSYHEDVSDWDINIPLEMLRKERVD